MRSLLFDSAAGPLVVGLAVGCLMLVATLIALAKPRGAWLKSRLEPYGGAGGAVGSVRLGSRARSTSLPATSSISLLPSSSASSCSTT
jgi:hypothetical protein